MTTTPISVQPIGDFQLSFSPNPLTGEITVDFVLAPNGDLAVVTGIPRLIQMIVLWLITPLGSNPFNPSYGNPFFAQLGRPSTSMDTYLVMLTACEQAFLTAQTAAAQAGQLSADEMVDHFQDNSVTMPSPGQLVVSFTVVAASGVSQSVALPFALALANFPLTSG